MQVYSICTREIVCRIDILFCSAIREYILISTTSAKTTNIAYTPNKLSKQRVYNILLNLGQYQVHARYKFCNK